MCRQWWVRFGALQDRCPFPHTSCPLFVQRKGGGWYLFSEHRRMKKRRRLWMVFSVANTRPTRREVDSLICLRMSVCLPIGIKIYICVASVDIISNCVVLSGREFLLSSPPQTQLRRDGELDVSHSSGALFVSASVIIQLTPGAGTPPSMPDGRSCYDVHRNLSRKCSHYFHAAETTTRKVNAGSPSTPRSPLPAKSTERV